MALSWRSIKTHLTGVSAPSYHPLRPDGLEATEDQATQQEAGIEKRYAYSLRTFRLSICFFVASIILYAAMLVIPLSDTYCERKMWAWSPILGVSQYQWHQVDSDILPDSLYGGPPTAERRDAWEHIVEDGFVGFPRDRMLAIRKSIDEDWWSLPPPHEDQVIAAPEYYHQLHCVRLLWMFAFRDQWDYTEGGNRSSLRYAVHTKHCYLALKRMLECQADITPVLFKEQGDESGVWETRNAPHKCKDFPTLLQWQADHTVCERPCMYS
ncbi:oxidase ustYa family protein, partial [Aspergillus ibericus CBS 121593]